ncbi:unnamed protein product [Rotaria sp. Silwood2]|nr:unnamed protein product [Rotaria sp. Silwood2]
MEDDNKAKELEDFVAALHNLYCNDSSQLKLIDEFAKDYNRHLAIYWYTKHTFIFETLNNALRMQDINMIIKMGFFIRDLHREIKQLHVNKINPGQLIVYRGQGMLTNEFEKMKNRKGGLLSFNNFLSTSVEKAVASSLAESNSMATNKIGILFEIEIDTSMSYAPFASVKGLSHFSAEQEILFSMHAVFRIGEMEETGNNLWKVKLKLTSDIDEELKRVTDSLRGQLGRGNGWYQLGYLMFLMDEVGKAKEIYSKLLELTSTDEWKELATIYNQLGMISHREGDYKKALQHFQKTAEIEEKYLSLEHPSLTVTYSNIAEIYHSMGKHLDALSLHQKVLQSREKSLPPNDPLLAVTHSNIAAVYQSMGDYQRAQVIFYKARKIGEIGFVPNDPKLATIYDNLATVHLLMGEHETALYFYKKVHEINRKTLPSNHSSLLMTCSNIALMYNSMDYQTALIYLHKTRELDEKALGVGHPDLAYTHHNIAHILEGLSLYEEALLHIQKAVDITSRTCEPDDDRLKMFTNYRDTLRMLHP